MKAGSDNFRSSSIKGIIQRLKKAKKEILIYEPNLKDKKFMGLYIEKDLKTFKKKSDLIISNRYSNRLNDVKNKVFSRDIFLAD